MDITVGSKIEDVYKYIDAITTVSDDKTLNILYNLHMEMQTKEEVQQKYMEDVTRFNLLMHRFISEEEYEICARIKWFLDYLREEYIRNVKKYYTYTDDDKEGLENLKKIAFDTTKKVWDKQNENEND